MTTPLTAASEALLDDLHEPHWHADQHKCRAFLMTEDCTCGGRDRLAAIEAAARQPLLDRIAALEGKHSSYCSSQAGPGEDCVVCNPRARRIAALEAALPEDPWMPRQNSSIGVKCYACFNLAMHRTEGIHAPDCKWVAALAGTGRVMDRPWLGVEVPGGGG